ncbi:hypothetical protein WJX74_009027 [Apatococcus lobatus]|uniref:EF-hand domain-containing protein n=1 Tax=Apatococcus lobatus TaxID=904363 RepID=A0AAW1SAF4_9CHLO
MIRRRLAQGQGRQLAKAYNLRQRDVRRLWTWFDRLDSGGLGLLNLEEACALPCFRCNPFAERIIRLVSPHEDGKLCFEDLLTVMGSVFRPGVPTTAKHVYAFALWDFDGDDLIGADDIRAGLKLLLHKKLSSEVIPGGGEEGLEIVSLTVDVGDEDQRAEDQLNELVERTLAEVDPEGLGIDYNDFSMLLQRMPDFLSNFQMSI